MCSRATRDREMGDCTSNNQRDTGDFGRFNGFNRTARELPCRALPGPSGSAQARVRGYARDYIALIKPGASRV